MGRPVLLRGLPLLAIALILSLSVVKEGALARFMVITPTYDGSGQAVHPDVIYLERGLGGRRYRYWMVFTPYPKGDYSRENPSILVSGDGRSWFVPRGLVNPLAAPPPKGHYSDPDMFSFRGELWIFFRWSYGLEERIYAKSSRDGISWSDEVKVLETSSESLLSPSVVVENGTLRMWYIDNRPNPNVLKMRTSRAPEGPWSEPTVCDVDGVPEGRELWHLDVVRVSGGYDSFIVLINKGRGLREAELYFATSKDGVKWRLSEIPILMPSVSDWDNYLIYRSSALLLREGEEGGTSFRKYALWYSACNKDKEWHIGYAELSICISGDELLLCDGF
ncbi:MAG: hypothetical protein QXG30_05000 [Candidatus Korarchaeum sp.]